MVAAVLAVAMLQAIPASAAAPTPLPTLSPSWISEPLESLEYARFVRHEADGTDSTISALRQPCDCQPADAMQKLVASLSGVGSVSIKRDQVTACGQQGERILATGVASPANVRKNIESVLFRQGDDMVELLYTFRYTSPMWDAEAAMLSLCGQ